MRTIFIASGITFLVAALSIFLYYEFIKKEEKKLSHPWKNERFIFNVPEIKTFSKKHDFFSDRPIIAKVSKSKEDLYATEQLLHVIHEKIKDPQKRILAAGEVLSKVVAYRDLSEKDIIPVPITTPSGKNIIVHYYVDKIFDIWGGMPAFGLLPLNHKDEAAPILLFRGTDSFPASKRAWASLLSDLDFDGPGYHAFMKSKDLFGQWMIDANASFSRKTRAIGYSLGGAFATYTVIFESELVSSDPFQPCMAFNSPGVINKVVQKWNRIDQKKRPLFLNFTIKNDIVSKYGHLIGYNYKLIPNNKFLFLQAHVKLLIGEDEFYLHLLNHNL